MAAEAKVSDGYVFVPGSMEKQNEQGKICAARYKTGMANAVFAKPGLAVEELRAAARAGS